MTITFPNYIDFLQYFSCKSSKSIENNLFNFDPIVKTCYKMLSLLSLRKIFFWMAFNKKDSYV
jgi:hypothetical protein